MKGSGQRSAGRDRGHSGPASGLLPYASETAAPERLRSIAAGRALGLPRHGGKGNCTRTVALPARVKAQIKSVLMLQQIKKTASSGPKIGRQPWPERKSGTRRAIWRLVMRYAEATTSESSGRTTFTATAPISAVKGGEELDHIEFPFRHAPIKTTDRYLGTEQAVAHAVVDDPFAALSSSYLSRSFN